MEGEIPVPNLPNMLPLDGVPSGNSTSSSSSSSPSAAKETENRPTEKPHKPNIVRYYGEPFFSIDLLSQKVIDKRWRVFKDNYSWNPYRADIPRRDFEDLCVNDLENFAVIERRLRREKIIQRHSRVRAYQLLLRMMRKIGVKPAGYFIKRTKGGVKADCRMLYHLNHFMMDQGRSFSGRRLVPPSSDNNGIPHTERKLSVPNSWHKLQVPPVISKPSSSSVNPCAMEKTGETPEQKPLEQIIVRYYGKAYFSWSSLPQDAKDESFKRFSANYRWDPSISDLVRRDYEKTCAKTTDEMADMERRLRMEQKLVQRCSRSRVHQLHVKFLRKISRNPMGLLKKRMNGGIGYWGDCQRSISIIKPTIYSGRGLKSGRRKLKASVGERSTGGRQMLTDQKRKRPVESSSESFRASDSSVVGRMDEARRAEQRKKFKYELEKKDEKFEELNQKLEAVLEQISQKVLGCSLPWLGTRPPPAPPLS